MVAWLLLAMLLVGHYQQRLVEEDLLSFRLTHAVFVSALAGIAFVPVKAGHLFPVDHTVYIFTIYSN